MQLSINEDALTDPKATAKPRLIKQLPPNTEDVDVFNIFRPYGPIKNAQRILNNLQGNHTGFRGMALVTYYHEEDAQRAQSELHCAEVEGKSISVSIDIATRKPAKTLQDPGFSAAATPFVPGAATTSQTMSATAPVFQPPHQRASSDNSTLPGFAFSNNSQNQQNGDAMMSVAGTNLHYSPSAATYIDPCNLFIKNLDPSIDSNFLFNLFKPFGRIVSARVMRDERGLSREFGFVSYRFPGDADRALRTMNKTLHGSKEMIVRLHEPKNVRQEKLSQNKVTNSYNGPIDSPIENGGPSSEVNGSSGGSRSPRRKQVPYSDGYFKASAGGKDDGVAFMDIDQLKMMSSSVRVDTIKSELSQRIKAIEGIGEDQVDELVSELNKLKLPDAVDALNNPLLLAQRLREVQTHGHIIASPTIPSSELMSPSLSFDTERERLLYAVTTLLPVDSPVEDITDLLIGLPKKERAMALFNQDYLQKKVDEARAILEIAQDDEEALPQQSSITKSTTPLTKNNIDLTTTTPPASTTTILPHDEQTHTYTLSELAKMSALEIIKLTTTNPQIAGLSLPKADPATINETNAFIDSLQNLSATDQKQKLGDQLFKKIRTFGVKGAPKISELSLLRE